jgi:ADP-heptose:LPS heptosyltransferase
MGQVLFIQLSRLGDCIQSTPLLASWRKRFPDDRIVVLTRPEHAIVFTGNRHVDEVLRWVPPVSLLADETIDPVRRLEGLRDWLGPLKSRHFRVVVNLTHDSLSCWMALALQPTETRGLSMDRSGRMQTGDPWGLYTFSLLKFRQCNLLNIVDSYARMSGGESAVEAPVLDLDPADRLEVASWCPDLTDGHLVIGFQPGASRVERRWPMENFIALGRRLGTTHGARILVFGAKNEQDLGATISRDVPGAINLAGKTSIGQLAALLSHCAVLVTNDTGTMHVASAVGPRIVALFESSAYFRETGPYGRGHWVIQSPEILDYGERTGEELARIRRIPPEEVAWAVDSLLNELQKGADLPLEVPASLRAQHFRSFWASGGLDFCPVRPHPPGPEIVSAYLQRPIWLATLDDRALALEETAVATQTFLQKYYAADEVLLRSMIHDFRRETESALPPVQGMKRVLQSGLEKLRRNPKYLIPEDQVAQLSQLEQEILQMQRKTALLAFLAYFETALALVAGDTTRRYLESYLQPVLLLEKQLLLFSRLLSVCDGTTVEP